MEPVTLQAVAAFARSTLGASQVEPLPGGTWSQAFALAVGSEQLVLRIGGDRRDYELDRLAGGWAQPDLPIPEVLDIGRALDRWFVLSRRVHGTPLADLDRASWRGGLASLMDALVALSAVDVSRAGAGPLDPGAGAAHRSWRGWMLESAADPVGHRLGNWRTAMSSDERLTERYDAAVAQLASAVVSCPEHRNVVHTDLAGNTLVAGGRVTGIFDWSNAVIGDSAYDVAHLTFWAPWHPGCPEADLRASARRFLGDDADDRIRVYELHVALEALRFNSAMRRPRTIRAVVERMDRLRPTP